MKTVKAGSRGTDVLTLQKLLILAGAKITADGIYGHSTELAVEEFQKSRNQVVDGIVGPATWEKLELVTPSSGAVIKDASKWIKGVDLSHWEKGFDFAKGVKDGVVFMMTKASEGLGLDSTCAALCEKAKEAGIKFTGIYHFFHANLGVSEQIDEYLAQYNKIKTEMGPILDLEETSVNGRTFSQVREAALVWLVRMEQITGKTPILYIDMNMLNQTGIAKDARFNRFTRWIARYSSSEPTDSWSFWQYTDKGEQGADTDWYHGTIEDMAKQFGVA